MRTAATTWNSAAKYPGGALLFFLLQNALGYSVDTNVQVDGSIWWLPQRVSLSVKTMSHIGESISMVDLGVSEG